MPNFSLQSINLCAGGSGVDKITYVWNTVIRPVLTYVIQNGNVNKTTSKALEKKRNKFCTYTFDF